MKVAAKLFYSGIILLLGLFICMDATAQPFAFSGAEGYGKFTKGGRGGEIMYVSNLNDRGPGSFREDVGGWPELKSGEASTDSDRDGMSDQWEQEHHLDPDNPVDANEYTLDESYTNIEIYLNNLVNTITENGLSQ